MGQKMVFFTVLNQIGVLFGLILIGYVLKKTNKINDSSTSHLSNLLMDVALPAAIIMSLQRPFEKELFVNGLLFLVLTVLAVVVGYFITIAFNGALKIKDPERPVWLITGMTNNITFMGAPIVIALYGDIGFVYISFGNISFNIVHFCFSYAVFLPKEQKKGFRMFLLNLKTALLQPAVLSCFIGVIFFVTDFKIPSPISDIFSYVGPLTTPISMIMIGSLVSRFSFKELFGDWKPYVASSIRLIIVPIIEFLLLAPFIKDHIFLGVHIVATAMPIATIGMILGEKYGGYGALTSKYIVISTLLSIITLPTVSLLVTYLMTFF